MKRLITRVDDEEQEVIIEQGSFRIDDATLTIVEENPLVTTIEINGEIMTVDEVIHLEEENIYRVEIRGYTIDVAVIDPISEALGGGGASGDIHSPMAGTVSAVRVSEGDTVAEGQVLLIISAMKMENQITSPLAGRVAKIEVEPDDQVPTGKLLVVIEAE